MNIKKYFQERKKRKMEELKKLDLELEMLIESKKKEIQDQKNMFDFKIWEKCKIVLWFGMQSVYDAEITSELKWIWWWLNNWWFCYFAKIKYPDWEKEEARRACLFEKIYNKIKNMNYNELSKHDKLTARLSDFYFGNYTSWRKEIIEEIKRRESQFN